MHQHERRGAPSRASHRESSSSTAVTSTRASSTLKPCSSSSSSTSNNSRAAEEDDLELPVVTTKPLSSAASIAKFHRIHTHDHSISTRRIPISSVSSPSSAAAASSASSSSSRHRKRPSNAPNKPLTGTKSKHQHYFQSVASAKKLHRHNRLSALVLHSVTPRECQALNANGFPNACTQYDVVVENVRSAQIWQVSRRFSSFVYFRKELTALFDTPHCHHCTEMHAKLDTLHDDFPSKRLWGSNKPSVVKQRAQKLEVYLKGLLTIAAKSHTKSCKLVASSFAMHVRSFLTVESSQFQGIPGGDFGHMIPSLLQQLSSSSAAFVSAAHKRAPLATILEHTSGSGSALALMDKIEEAETEDEDDDEEEEEEDDAEEDTASTSDDNQREDHDEV